MFSDKLAVTWLPPNQGIQKKSENFIFNQGKSGKIEIYLEKSGKMREVLDEVLNEIRVTFISF